MKFNKRILIIAYACESDKGSEPAVGWNWTKMLAKLFKEVYVITRENNVDSIKNGLVKENINNVKIIKYDLPQGMLILKKKLRITRLYYYLWQIGAVNKIKKMRLKLDIIQHVTFVNDYIPSMFYKLKCDKFVWGPIGSNEAIHNMFIKNNKHKLLDRIKHVSKYIQRKVDFNFNLCIKRSNYIIGTNNKVKGNLKINESKFSCIPAIGIESLDNKHKTMCNDIKRIMFIGNLVPIKNPYLALEAFLKFNSINTKSEFWILGDGPELNRMKVLSERYNKIDNVKFLGKVNRDEVIKRMREADVVLFPTLESAGFVTLESMAVGTPVISLDIGGPAQYTPKDLQVILNKCETLNDVSNDIVNKINDVVSNYEHYSKECINRVKLYTWDEKEKQIEQIYKNLLGENDV